MTKEDIIKDVLEKADLLQQHPINRDDYFKISRYSKRKVISIFGGWANVTKEVFGYSKIINKEDIIKDVISIYNKVFKIPTQKEYKSHGKYNIQTIFNKFGSWNNLLEIAFSVRRTSSKKCSSEFVCKNCGKLVWKQPNEIKNTNHIFCSLTCSGTWIFKNKIGKKRGGCVSKIEKLIQKHLNELFSFEIFYNSKETIGMELDVYIPSLKLAFEINGITHYKPIYGETKYNRTLELDYHKKMLCVFGGVSLFVIDISTLKYNKKNINELLVKIFDIIHNHQRPTEDYSI